MAHLSLAFTLNRLRNLHRSSGGGLSSSSSLGSQLLRKFLVGLELFRSLTSVTDGLVELTGVVDVGPSLGSGFVAGVERNQLPTDLTTSVEGLLECVVARESLLDGDTNRLEGGKCEPRNEVSS